MERQKKQDDDKREVEGRRLTCGGNVIKEWWRGEAIQEEGGLGRGHGGGGGRGGATWEREGKSNTLGFIIIAFFFFSLKENPKFNSSQTRWDHEHSRSGHAGELH